MHITGPARQQKTAKAGTAGVERCRPFACSTPHAWRICTVLMGDLGISTRATRVKAFSQLDQAFYVHPPAMVAHAGTKNLPPAHGLRFISIDRDRASHRTPGTGHGQHTVFDLSHIDLVAVTIGAGMHYLPKKCRNISTKSQNRTQQVGTTQSIAIHKGTSTIVVTISPLPNPGHFHFGSNQ